MSDLEPEPEFPTPLAEQIERLADSLQAKARQFDSTFMHETSLALYGIVDDIARVEKDAGTFHHRNREYMKYSLGPQRLADVLAMGSAVNDLIEEAKENPHG